MEPYLRLGKGIDDLRHLMYFHVDRLCQIGAEFWIRLAAIGLASHFLKTEAGGIFLIIAVIFLAYKLMKCAGRLFSFFKKPCNCGKLIPAGENDLLGLLAVFGIWSLGALASEALYEKFPDKIVTAAINPLILAVFSYMPILTLRDQSEDVVLRDR